MTIRSILVEIDRDARNPERLTLAVNLAERHGAHLTGLFAYAGLSGTYPYAQGRIALEMLRRYAQTPQEASDKLRAEFEHRADSAGLSHEWRMQEEEGAHSILATQARYADVVVVSQAAPGSPASGHGYGLAEDVVVASGSPTIVVPYAGTFDKTVDKVMIAWNGSRESSRAVRDALPILRAVDEVIVFSVNPDHDHQPGAEIANHLARHGIRTDVQAHHRQRHRGRRCHSQRRVRRRRGPAGHGSVRARARARVRVRWGNPPHLAPYDRTDPADPLTRRVGSDADSCRERRPHAGSQPLPSAR